MWFDGAKGENAKDMTYDFDGYWAMVRELQPNAVMFSDAGPDVRWVGNEAGNAGETCWSTINTAGLAPGKADSKYLNRGDPNGKQWVPAETDVSIRPGWFYHPAEDAKVRSGKNLVNLYYQSVGRNSLLLLNVPPNREGLLSEPDIASLKEFRSILDETFKSNLVAKQPKLTDGKLSTFTTLSANQPLVLELNGEQTFDRIVHSGEHCHRAAGSQRKGRVLERYRLATPPDLYHGGLQATHAVSGGESNPNCGYLSRTPTVPYNWPKWACIRHRRGRSRRDTGFSNQYHGYAATSNPNWELEPICRSFKHFLCIDQHQQV